MPSSNVRVLLVEDSPIALTILQRLLASAPDIEVVGTARNGIEALDLIPKLDPTVVCTDLHMPKMGGLELTRQIMATYPRPILVISASVDEDNSENAFQLLQAGALDIFPKPRTGLSSGYEEIRTDLINRIKVLAGVSVFTHRQRMSKTQFPVCDVPTVQPSKSFSQSLSLDIRAPKIVAIGASTGGPQAFRDILQPLPATFPVPIVCVQHISEGFLLGLVTWLKGECAIQIQIAQAGEIPQAGTVYFAPDNYHLQIDSRGCLQLAKTLPVAGHRPSVDVLFQSIAAYYRRSCVGILLTGMGRDGADGLFAIAQSGGTTIAQDESSCVVFGMPKEAIALNAAQYVLPISEISPMLLTKIFVTP